MGLILAISASFWAPKAVFAVQDHYQAGSVTPGARDVLELARFDLEYEHDLSVRLQNFAAQLAAGKEFYAVATDFKEDEINEEMIDGILKDSNDWIEVSFELTGGAVSWAFLSDMELVSSKKYVIFDGDFDAGIALSCLYVELYSAYYGNVYALFDLEDSTIYYYEVEVNADIPELWGYVRHNKSYENFYNDWEAPYWIAYYYGMYYQSNTIIDTENEMINEKILMDSNMSPEVWGLGFSRLLTENHVSFSVEMPFQEESLHMKMELQHDAGEFETIKAVVGLAEIGDLIPEFNRD